MSDLESTQNYHPMTLGQWMLTTFLAQLPIAGLVLLFIWAFGSGHHPSKSSWAKAMLIWQAIGLGIVIIMMIIILAVA
tara:strand:+ start:79 stop:312 length:234 start_codon:yes stop_codon:yes gene_type:complete